MDIFGKTKKKRKEVDSTPNLPRNINNILDKNTIPPSISWNYASRSSTIPNYESHRDSISSKSKTNSLFLQLLTFFFCI
jgi:hypothetical protein